MNLLAFEALSATVGASPDECKHYQLLHHEVNNINLTAPCSSEAHILFLTVLPFGRIVKACA